MLTFDKKEEYMGLDLASLKEIISGLSGIKINDIEKESALIEDLALDSLKFVELMAILAEEHQIIIDENDALEIQTVGQLYEIIKRQS
jgi:acyl carrier protein